MENFGSEKIFPDTCNDTVNFNHSLWLVSALTTSLFGFVSNSLIFVVIIKFQDFKEANYRLVLGVVISDSIFNAFFSPFESIQSHYFFLKNQILGSQTFCVVEGGFYAVTYTSSCVGQMLVAMNRFVAVFMPFYYKTKINTSSVTAYWLVVAWVLPLIYFFGGYSTWFDYNIDPLLGDCREYPTGSISKHLISSLTIYIPVSVSLLAYFFIFCRIIASRQTSRQRVIRRARGSAAMFVCTVLLLGSLFPQWIIGDTGDYDFVANRWKTLWLKFLFRSSFAINPVFYYLLDERIRLAMSLLLNRNLPGVNDAPMPRRVAISALQLKHLSQLRNNHQIVEV